MLLQFLVQNYLSIRDEAILSLEPSTDKEHPENIVQKDRYRAINLVAIYGANASGKSSLFKAMTTALNVLRGSNIRQVNDRVPVVPFKFDRFCISAPSKFEFTFVADDNKKYVYGYTADQTRIHEEYLYRYSSSKPSLIFDRKENEYKFSRQDKKNLEPLVRMNTENKLFLATATAWNVESTMIPYNWLEKGIDSYTNDENIPNIGLNMYRSDMEENVLFTKELLKQADININDIQVDTKKIENAAIPFVGNLIIGGQQVQMTEQYEIRITTGHEIIGEDNVPKTYNLSLGEESLGTQQLFFLSPLLRQTFEKGKVLVVDEIDRSLHPFIVKFLVNLFRSPTFNRNGAQLIFTTHETTLLSLDTFRRDQIYFTEKDSASGATSLYSLDEFSIRKTDNIEKGYLLGRYGAIPFLHTEEIV